MDEQVKSTEIRRRDAGLHESIDVADYHFQKPVAITSSSGPAHPYWSQRRGGETYVCDAWIRS